MLLKIAIALFIIGAIAVLEDWFFYLLKRILFPYSIFAERA